jgi:general L-amino acid transport system permease protein
MASQDITPVDSGSAKASLLNDPKIRGIFFQAVVIVLLVGASGGSSTIHCQPAALPIASGFRLSQRARRLRQFSAIHRIAYSSDSTYITRSYVGIPQHSCVAVVGIITATIIGFVVGIGRLSQNWLIRKICTVYVEVFRNIPPLLVIFFWYSACSRCCRRPARA